MKIVTVYLFSTTDIDMLTIHIIFAENVFEFTSTKTTTRGKNSNLSLEWDFGIDSREQFVDYTGIYRPYNFALRAWNLKQQSIMCLQWTASQAYDIFIFFLAKRASLYTTSKYPASPCMLPKVCFLSAVAVNQVLVLPAFFGWPLAVWRWK